MKIHTLETQEACTHEVGYQACRVFSITSIFKLEKKNSCALARIFFFLDNLDDTKVDFGCTHARTNWDPNNAFI